MLPESTYQETLNLLLARSTRLTQRQTVLDVVSVLRRGGYQDAADHVLEWGVKLK